MGSENGYRGLLVDYGGVLTSSLFDSFAAFCSAEGLAPDSVASRFASDRDCRRLLIDLETAGFDQIAPVLRTESIVCHLLLLFFQPLRHRNTRANRGRPKERKAV